MKRLPAALVSAVLYASLAAGCHTQHDNLGPGGSGDPGGGSIPSGAGNGGGMVVPAPPANDRAVFNFDYGWKFTKASKDIPSASQASFDDSAWTDVSLPHTINDTDTWVDWVGWTDDARLWLKYEGLMWYRKHFTLDATYKDRKIFLEFQGIRNAAVFYVNGTKLGIHENQVGPCGLDITSAVKFGADNVIAVQVDSNMLHKETSTGYTYGWSSQGFYPLYGGLTKDVVLHVTDKLHQTLPLYSNLGTSGIYAYATDIDTLSRTATLTVESEVANEYTATQTATFTVDLIDYTGQVVWTRTAAAQTIAAGQATKLTVSGQLTGLRFWAPDYPYLYTVRSSIKTGGTLVDVTDTTFGIRRISFSAKNGLMVNGHPVYLKGFSPRTVMDWAVVGNPQDWMTEYDFLLMKNAHANFIRPMHVAPRRHMVESADRLGIILACPAGNGEGDDADTAEGNARWQQRLGVMRDVTIYYRNDPSVFFYEASNSGITDQHMRDMVAVRDQWDPHGGRYAGTRSSNKTEIPSEEYGSSMDGLAQNATIPIWDAEYSREESPRRVWDAITPVWDPHTSKFVTGGYLAIASPFHVRETAANTGNGIYAYPNCDFRQMSTETMALCNVYRYWDRYSRSAFVLDEASRISKGVMVGGSKIFFADSDSDGRMKDTEVSRVSGTVDGVRLPKESYFAMQVAQNDQPQVHIVGHWSYAAGTRKKVYVVSNTEAVKLATYDPSGNLIKDYGQGVRDNQMPKVNQYVFRFDDVAWQPGRIVATAQNGGMDVATRAKVSAGAPVAIKLTPVLGPDGFFADGADIAMIDVEIVDAAGNRVPTDEAEVDFVHSGEGQFLGGYNSGVRQSTFKDSLWTEAGINRVFVRATRKAGDFTLTVKRAGLPDASVTITSKAFPVDANGLTTTRSQRYSMPLPTTEPTPVADTGVSPAGTGSGGSGGGSGSSCSVTLGANEECRNGLPAPKFTALPVGFSIDATEVTRTQYAAWLATLPKTTGQDAACQWNDSFQPNATCLADPLVCTNNCDRHPQVCVDWCDAAAYCKAVGKQLCGARADALAAGTVGFADFANAEKDQFQYACSADGKQSYVYGASYDATACNTGCTGAACATIPAGSRSTCQGPDNTSAFPGVFDLNGNVAEWDGLCDGTTATSLCHVRGGSMSSAASGSTCEADARAARNGTAPDVGFRCCSAE